MYKTNLKTITDVVTFKDIKAVVAAAKMTKDDEIASIGLITYSASDIRAMLREADDYRMNILKVCYGLYDAVDMMLSTNHLNDAGVQTGCIGNREFSIHVSRKLDVGDTNYNPNIKNGSGNWAFKFLLNYEITSVKHVVLCSNYEILDAGDKGYGRTLSNTTKIILDGCTAIQDALAILSEGNPVIKRRQITAKQAESVNITLSRMFKDSFASCGHGRDYLETAPAYAFQYNDGHDWAENPFVVYPYTTPNQDDIIPMFSTKWRKRATLINMKAELEGIFVGQGEELYPCTRGYFNNLHRYLNSWLKKVTTFTWRRDKNINRYDPKYTLMRYLINSASVINDELSQLAIMEMKNSKMFESINSGVQMALATDVANIIVATLTLPFCRVLGRVPEASSSGAALVAFSMEEFGSGESKDLDDLVEIINAIFNR
jgi:hypothetical protein